jgi:hypothetical protein
MGPLKKLFSLVYFYYFEKQKGVYESILPSVCLCVRVSMCLLITPNSWKTEL